MLTASGLISVLLSKCSAVKSFFLKPWLEQIGSSLLWSARAASWGEQPCVPLCVCPWWPSPAGGADTVYSIPLALPDFALLLCLHFCHLVTVIFLSALLAPALLSLSQMILVTLVTGHEEARLALGEAEQDVMQPDWEAGFGMCCAWHS